MKHLSFSYKDKKALRAAQKEAQKTDYSSQLIQLFTAPAKKEKIKKLLRKLKEKFPKALIIGTTTAGEISHGKIYDNSSIISLSLFQNTQLQAHYVNNIHKKTGKKLSKKICSKDTKAAVVLSEGLQGSDYEGFIKGIKAQNPQIIIAGGLAGDNFLLEKTYIFLGENIYEKGAIGVSFSGEKLFAQNNYNLNWAPIGKSFTITHSQGNIVSKIDGEDAVTVFRKYLGEEIFADNAAALPDFQLLYKEGSTTVARTPMSIQGKSILLAGPIAQGQRVQFGFSNASAVVSGSNAISQKMAQYPMESIYIYSCIARKTLLGKTLEKEFAAFEHLAPTSGFFTYGEFYSTSANNALLNCTTTILALSEAESNAKKETKPIVLKEKALDNITFSALTHFIERTSHELKENLEFLHQYKSAVDMTSLISKTDPKGIITYVNDNFCKTSKYSRKELLGSNHNIVRDPEVSAFVFKKMWQNISQGRVWRGTFSNRAKDGSIYYVDTTIIPILDANGKIKEYMGIRQDITKQVSSKKRIQEKERLIKAIFDNQDSIVIYVSAEKQMLNVNKKLFEYLDFEGVEAFKAKYSCICDLFIEEEGYVHPKQHPNWIEDIADEKLPTSKAKLLAKDNSVHIFNISIKRIDAEYIINLNDITSLEEALQKAYLSEQTKTAFLANMSHEIRTPLNGILGFTDILQKQELDKEVQRYVDIIHKSGQTLLNVVNDILDFSKLESGEFALFESETNLVEEMEAAVSTFASLSKKKHLDYYIYIDPNIPTILKCDIQRIKQVLNNLISNALKFTPEKGTVKVDISLENIEHNMANIAFRVSDTGIGIEKKKLATIFNAFSQADNSISREFGGTGLGLSISSQYIKMMGSELKVKSTHKQGSEFYFTLALPIVKNIQKYAENLSNNSFKIQLIGSQNETSCGINAIIKNYLHTWRCKYEEIFSLEQIDKDTDILIICAKLFDQESCKEALQKYAKLHLIFIEDAQTTFSCSHEKFHLIEQPMTGSALFDTIISLTHENHSAHSAKKENAAVQSYSGNILVAEDNETNQMLISIMLKERNIDYKIANNGQEAVDAALAEDAAYDMILMDINMPLLDGVSATKILREKGYKRPIISLSANVIESDRISFKEAGVNDTLNKPLRPSELDAILTKYLQTDNNPEFDNVNLEQLSQELLIEDKEVIKTLLKSFATTTEKILHQLKENSFECDTMHNLKGVAGNMRFEKLYALAQKAESEFETLSNKERQKYASMLIAHIEHLQKEIGLASLL